MSALAALEQLGGTAGKLERIEQLAAHGLNTPRLIRIEAGTPFTDDLRERLREEARGDELMTVRTYHPTDETRYAKGPFHPEIPVEEAITLAEELSAKWHVLYQEAIDVNETILAGNVLLNARGTGSYEALAGRYRVRDVEHPPREAEDALRTGSFAAAKEIPDPYLRELVERVLESRLLEHAATDDDEQIVVEFNVQERPVGRRREQVLLWEWRPFAPRRPATAAAATAIPDGRTYGVNLRGLPAPAEDLGPATLGGKGFSLVRMAWAGLPVPPAAVFSVTRGGVPRSLPRDWRASLADAVAALADETTAGRLVSVRSSPTASMPGMLDTVLDVPLSLEGVEEAFEHVLASWWSERASAYRSNTRIEGAGLAVIVQLMVDGRRNASSGTGVGFTRNPRTGDPDPLIEYAPHARGEEIVSGRMTPLEGAEFASADPKLWAQIRAWTRTLEQVFGDVQEFEFTVESGSPYLLQSRATKRTDAARLRIAHDLVDEGLVEEAAVRAMVEAVDLRRLTQQQLASGGAVPITRARTAAPGAAVGRIALHRDHVPALRGDGDPVILVTETTDPADYPVMASLVGVLTHLGGVTSHAAVAALEAGIVALVGCAELQIEAGGESLRVGGVPMNEGDWISIQGNGDGEVFVGRLDLASAELPAGLTSGLLDWAAEVQARGA